MMTGPLLTFVQISDSHVGPTPDFNRYSGVATLPFLEQSVTAINNFPEPPDFVVHTGDIIDDRSEAACKLAAEVLAQLNVPLYCVNGNHDDQALLRRYFDLPVLIGNPATDSLDYTFQVRDEHFLVLDTAHNDIVRDPLGVLTDEQLALVSTQATPIGPPLTVFLHHTPWPLGSPWFDKHMPLVNADALHETLLPARDRLRGVFHGHAHRSHQVIRDGITYVSAGSTFAQFGWRPWDERPAFDRDFPPTYNLVQFFHNRTVVHQYMLP